MQTTIFASAFISYLYTMRYFIISNPTPVRNELKIVNYLLEHLPVTFHLRKPNFTQDLISKYLREIDPQFHSKIVLHSHHILINHYSLKGIHFTSHNKKNIFKYKDYSGSKSISTHSLDEILSFEQPFNYYFLSPIFESTSKPGYGGNNFDFSTLRNFILNYKSKKIVALGGIKINNIQHVRTIGFYGAAILGNFWQKVDNSDYKSNIKEFAMALNLS